MRLHNQHDIFEDGKIKNIEVDPLQIAVDLFSVANHMLMSKTTLSLKEVSLTGNQDIEEMTKKEWTVKKKEAFISGEQSFTPSNDAVTLTNQEMRTWRVKFDPKREFEEVTK
jgi:hypothetical protein